MLERVRPVAAQASPVCPSLIMQTHISETSSSTSFPPFPSPTEGVQSAAQLDVQRAAAPHCSEDTESNLLPSRNSIITPGSCSTTRE